MNRNILKTVIRSIRSSLGRYVAIAAIVALGSGFYSGIVSAQPAMRKTAADYVYNQHMYDYRFLTALGLTEENLETLAGLDYVQEAEGAYFSEAYVMTGKESEPFRIMSLTRRVALPYLTVGRMPEKADECLGDDLVFSSEDIGKVVSIAEHNSEDTLEGFTVKEFTLVGLAKSPRFMSKQRGSTTLGAGELKGFIIVPPEAFDSEAYHEALLFCGIDNAFTADYTDMAESYEARLEELLTNMARERYRKVRAETDLELTDARKELDDGWQEYYDGEKEAEQELADARQELVDGQEKIDKGRKQISDGWNQYNSGRLEIADAEKELAAGKKELAEKEEELNAGQATLDSYFTELESRRAELAAGRQLLDEQEAAAVTQAQAAARQTYSQVFDGITALEELLSTMEETDPAYAENAASLEALKAQSEAILSGAESTAMSYFASAEEEYNTGKAALDGYEAELNSQQQTLDEGKTQLEQGKAELAAGEQELEEGRTQLDYSHHLLLVSQNELNDAQEELEQGKKDLAQAEKDVKKELADGLKELEDGEQEYADGVAEAEEKIKLESYLLTRESNSGCATYKNDITIIQAVAKAFPIFFILIVAFVCVTTMTRMINEERTQIGTMKALGYSAPAIMSRYLLYSGSAAAIGCLTGLALGLSVFPNVIWMAYGILYNYTPLEPYVNMPLCIGVFAVAVSGTAAVTIYSCEKSLRSKPAALMRPKSPAKGKRILLERIKPLWSRLGFLTKVMLRNAFRYPSRVMMMLLGIGGCTALIIAATGLKDSVANVLDYQYGEIFLYDIKVSYSEGEQPDREELEKLLSQSEDYALVYMEESTLEYASDTMKVNILSCDSDELEGIIDLHYREKQVAFPGKGLTVISQKAADTLGIKEGDEICLSNDNVGALRLVVGGICENYLDTYAYVAADTIPDIEVNTALVAMQGLEETRAAAVEFRDLEGVGYVSLSADEREVMDNSMQSLDLVIFLVIGCAGALAFITIFNLTNINIMERVREIATVKVLGFHRNETASYILNENVLLSLLGVAAGIPLGKVFHAFIMGLVQVDKMAYDVRVSLLSYLVSAAVATAFVLVSNLLMMPAIKKVNMAESLKSVE